MKQSASILLLAYYLFGTLCLPQGDFSCVVDLPRMYQHCKTTEDKDMTPIDFITDHLVNIDGIFDHHDNGDKQRPHSPTQLQHTQTLTNFVTPQLTVLIIQPIIPKAHFPVFMEHFYFSDYFSFVFRPPIV